MRQRSGKDRKTMNKDLLELAKIRQQGAFLSTLGRNCEYAKEFSVRADCGDPVEEWRKIGQVFPREGDDEATVTRFSTTGKTAMCYRKFLKFLAATSVSI